jgi:AraC-like DNA-binding protein
MSLSSQSIICPKDLYADAEENVDYDEKDFPFYLRWGKISRFAGRRVLAHFHHDFEYIYLASGVLDYDVNGEKCHLEAGEGIFVNSKMLHYGSGCGEKECNFLCLLFSPILLSSSPVIEEKSVSPYLTLGKSFLFFPRESAPLRTLQEIGRVKKKGADLLTYESLLFRLWKETLPFFPPLGEKEKPQGLEDVRTMMTYVRTHYAEDLSLAKIAQSAYLSESSATRLFRHYFHVSPIAYLIDYRLLLSERLLRETSASIEKIAFDVGYSSPSFFIRSFKNKYKETPLCYRKKMAKDSDLPQL